MKRYYYTDTLKAAWMAREFEVKFELILHDFETKKIGHILHLPVSDDLFHWPILNTEKFGLRYYVIPSCHDMLLPLVGDLITSLHEFELDKTCEEFPNYFEIEKSNELFHLTCLSQFILTEENIDDAWSYFHWKGQEIIQRQGKAWFTPEVEVAYNCGEGVE